MNSVYMFDSWLLQEAIWNSLDTFGIKIPQQHLKNCLILTWKPFHEIFMNIVPYTAWSLISSWISFEQFGTFGMKSPWKILDQLSWTIHECTFQEHFKNCLISLQSHFMSLSWILYHELFMNISRIVHELHMFLSHGRRQMREGFRFKNVWNDNNE